ncbi:MAG: hypothetical protein Q8L27_04540 [archaeon]|nr:hypothetical protein [archaeon]
MAAIINSGDNANNNIKIIGENREISILYFTGISSIPNIFNLLNNAKVAIARKA